MRNVRRLLFSFSLHKPFELCRHRQNDQREDRRKDGNPQRAQSDGHADRGGHPYSRGSRESFDFVFLTQFENGARANETKAGDDALNHARLGIESHTHRTTARHKSRSAETNQHMSAEAGGLVRTLALRPYHTTKNQSSQQANHYARDLLAIVKS